MKYKSVFSCFLLLLVSCLFVTQAFASDITPAAQDYIIDSADVLEDAEEDKLEVQAQYLADTYNVPIYFLAISDNESQENLNLVSEVNKLAKSGFGQGGKMLIVNVAQGVYDYQDFNNTNSDETLAALETSFSNEVANGNYFSFATTYYNECKLDLEAFHEQNMTSQNTFSISDIATDPVMDTANLLSESEIQSLREEALAVEAEHGISVYILTVNNYRDILDTDNPYEAATYFYTEKDLGYGEERDGVLLMLSMAARDYAYISYGDTANSIFDDSTKIDIEEEFLAEFASDDWYGGFYGFVYDTNFEIEYGWLDAFILIAIFGVSSLVISFSLGLFHYGQLKSVHKKLTANDFVPHGGVNIHTQNDVYTHTTTSKVRVSSSSGGGGSSGGGRSFSGGGFSGRSGKF